MSTLDHWEARWVGWGMDWPWLGTVGSVVSSVLMLMAILACIARPFRWSLTFAKLGSFVALFAITMTLASTLKDLVARPRPATAAQAPHAEARERSIHGLPSSHATLVGTATGIIVAQSPQIAVRVGALVFALVAGCVRVGKGLHYPSDVLAGWLLGLTLAWLVWHQMERWSNRRALC